jgi:hypothetical protein
MSATLDRRWLQTVDYKEPAAELPLTELEDEDLTIKPADQSRKPLDAAQARINDAAGLAKEIVAVHAKARARTLVVVDTIRRARKLHAAVKGELKAKRSPIEPILIHSRFRPPDRKEQIEQLLAEPPEDGMIVISTQVVEAGADVSARNLHLGHHWSSGLAVATGEAWKRKTETRESSGSICRMTRKSRKGSPSLWPVRPGALARAFGPATEELQ